MKLTLELSTMRRYTIGFGPPGTAPGMVLPGSDMSGARTHLLFRFAREVVRGMVGKGCRNPLSTPRGRNVQRESRCLGGSGSANLRRQPS